MLTRSLIFWGLVCLSFTFECTEKSKSFASNQLLVGFYNLDNLYDTINDPKTNDDEFTPLGKNQWNTYKYNIKLKNLSKVISNFNQNQMPDVFGVCEIENKSVLIDLANTVQTSTFEIIHFNSKDERGIDVALLYNKNKLQLIDSKKYTPILSKDSSDKTRDLLWVKLLDIGTSDTLQFIVCHFPSRREGEALSEPNRIDVAKLCKKIINEKCNLKSQNLIVMGDFNDEPSNKSIAEIIGAVDFRKQTDNGIYNLMTEFSESQKGSYLYKDQWNMLDQFLISAHLFKDKNFQYLPNSVFIKQDLFLFQKGKFAGYPHRTFAGNKWLNGYSDHLPIGFRIQTNDKKKN